MPPTKFHPQSPESLLRIAAEIDGLSDALRIAVADMERANIRHMQVGSYVSLTRGMDFLEGFVSAVRRATKKLRDERGDFQATEEDAVAFLRNRPKEIKDAIEREAKKDT